MTRVVYRATRPPREPQWWYMLLRPGSIVERDGQQWTLCSVFGSKMWRESASVADIYPVQHKTPAV